MNFITYQTSDLIDYLLNNKNAPIFGANEMAIRLSGNIEAGKDFTTHEELIEIAEFFYGKDLKVSQQWFIDDVQANINCYFDMPAEPSDEDEAWFIDPSEFNQ